MRTLAIALILAAAPASADRASLDVTGTYTSRWGAVTLHQRGAHVFGDYAYAHGHLDGMLKGNVVHYAWHEDDGAGHGVFVVATTGELIGTWGVGDDDTDGGGWRLVPDKPRTRAAIGSR